MTKKLEVKAPKRVPSKKKRVSKKQKDEIPFCELKDSVDKLEKRLERANSIRRVFWKGVLTGLGVSIGATIIFALLISTVSWIIDETQASWLRNLIETTGIDRAVGTD